MGASRAPPVCPHTKGFLMFANQRNRSTGFLSIGAVALVMALWLISTGVMARAWTAGGQSKLPSTVTCEVVCGPTQGVKG